MLINLLADKKKTKTTKLLAILQTGPQEGLTIAEIRNIALNNGLANIRLWNIGAILGGSSGKAVQVNNKWVLTDTGKTHLDKEDLLIVRPKINESDLYQIIDRIDDSQTKTFITEAVRAMEYQLHRSAIVLSWVGAVSIIQSYIYYNKLKEFNSELTNRNSKGRGSSKFKLIKVLDDFGLIKESEFLDICQSIGVIGKNVKNRLKRCLDARNSCGLQIHLKLAIMALRIT